MLLLRAVRNLFQASLLATSGLLANLWHPLDYRSINPISAFIFTWCTPCVCIHSSPFFKGHQSYWIRAHPNDLVLPTYICNDSSSE